MITSRTCKKKNRTFFLPGGECIVPRLAAIRREKKRCNRATSSSAPTTKKYNPTKGTPTNRVRRHKQKKNRTTFDRRQAGEHLATRCLFPDLHKNNTRYLFSPLIGHSSHSTAACGDLQDEKGYSRTRLSSACITAEFFYTPTTCPTIQPRQTPTKKNKKTGEHRPAGVHSPALKTKTIACAGGGARARARTR